MEQHANDFETMTTDVLLVAHAQKCAQLHAAQARRDKHLAVCVSLLMFFGGAMAGIASAYGIAYEGWPQIAHTMSLGRIWAGGCLGI